jgi:hypothetical protein
MFASAQMAGRVDTLSFTCQIYSFVIDKPATVFPLPSCQRKTNAVHKLSLTNSGLDCRNFVCTPALLLAMEGITLEILCHPFSLS